MNSFSHFHCTVITIFEINPLSLSQSSDLMLQTVIFLKFVNLFFTNLRRTHVLQNDLVSLRITNLFHHLYIFSYEQMYSVKILFPAYIRNFKYFFYWIFPTPLYIFIWINVFCQNNIPYIYTEETLTCENSHIIVHSN